MSGQGANEEVSIASKDELDVREFSVHQSISSLFQIGISAVSKNPDIDFEAAVGQEASFTLHGRAAGDKGRTWHGVCSELHQIGVEPDGLSTYRLSIVPRLWLATQRRNHRVFQTMTELDIAAKIIQEWGVDLEQKITSQYKTRKYRVQYGDTDFDFICRMLEEAGISFYFEEQEGKTVCVLSDAPQSNEKRAPDLPFRAEPNVSENEYVTAVRVSRQVRPGKVTMRDYDYRLPASYKLLSGATGENGAEDRLESYEYTPGAFNFESEKGEDTPFADDKGKHRTDEGEAAKLAQKRLRAERGDASTVVFQTNVIDLAPGVVMGVLDHPHRELSDGKRLLVVESRIDGRVDDAIAHMVEVRGADKAHHPALKTRKAKVQGVETATVVGPAGEEIHTDEFGRVRVQFHWDREGQSDENSSCWIHVSQPWGGAGYGGSNLPRVGQEVIVDYLNGDPDKPVITGRVYTNLQKSPYKLPANKTQSGWKSNTSPSNGGYNEMMFEDKQGQELLRMQAEKDLHKLVKNDENVNIGNDRTSSIGNDESRSIGNDAMKQVMNNMSEMIGMNRTRGVGNDENVQIGRNQSTTVGEKIEITCGKSKLTMDKDGNITLQGTKILVGGSDHVQVASELIDLN